MILVPGYHTIISLMSSVVGILRAWINAMYETGSYIEDKVGNAFDTGLYYVMNALMVIFQFFEMVGDVKDSVDHKINIVSAGYRNGFISNIN